LGTGAVILLYLGLNLFYIYAISPQEMSGVISIGGLAVGNLFGKSFENVFSLLISFALFSSLSAFIILGPRVYYSMARDGYFFKAIAEVHPVFNVPAKSIFLQGAIAMVIAISGSFDQILTYMGFSLGIFPILAALGVFQVRRRKMSAFQMPGYPIVPAIYIIAAVLILVLGFLRSPWPSSVAILTVLAGVPVYFIFKKTYGRKRIQV
jgi:APA family basic amino acid/polyamine antiporter